MWTVRRHTAQEGVLHSVGVPVRQGSHISLQRIPPRLRYVPYTIHHSTASVELTRVLNFHIKGFYKLLSITFKNCETLNYFEGISEVPARDDRLEGTQAVRSHPFALSLAPTSF
jgi:hypothetical protein